MEKKRSFSDKINIIRSNAGARMWLQIKKSGEINYIENQRLSPLVSVVKILEKYENIFEVFEFNKIKGLTEASDKNLLVPIKREFNQQGIFDFTLNFYSDLPVLSLRVFNLGDGDFLASVFNKNIFPNIQYDKENLFFYIDQNELIRGFNYNLFQYYPHIKKDPFSLLNTPLKKIISPTPLDLQKKYISEADKKRIKWEPVYDFESDPIEKLKIYQNDYITPQENSIDWNNTSPSGIDFITVMDFFDTFHFDIKFEVVAEKLKGSAPLLILGEEKNPLYNPDAEGYLCGDLYTQESFMMKKGGNRLAFINTAKPSGKVRYTLIKTGRSLLFQVNHKNLMQYYDADFLTHPKACLSIGTRAQSHIRIYDIKLHVHRAIQDNGASEKEQLITQSRKRPYHYFKMQRIFNTELNHFQPPYVNIDCYMLSNITHFQHTIDKFKKQYLSERKQGRQLKMMLADYKKEDSLFIGSSKFVQEIKEKVKTIADYTAPILIQGPTGTGKEVAARFIHQKSMRRDAPFIKVDCSALPPNLIESELFGHEKGAFTGAIERKIGKFEQAHKGTLFLDEVGNLSREVQAKLLNVLQDHVITRIGGTQSIALDIRILAATNIPLESLIKSNAFREDLFYRMNAVTIFLPPLKDRLDDIQPLCQYFLSSLNANSEKHIRDLTPAAYKKLYCHSFPGNIRELKNIVDRAFIFCEKDFIDEDAIQIVQTGVQEDKKISPDKRKYPLMRMEKHEMEALLKKHKGIVRDVAEALEVSRQACYHYMKKHGIKSG